MEFGGQIVAHPADFALCADGSARSGTGDRLVLFDNGLPEDTVALQNSPRQLLDSRRATGQLTQLGTRCFEELS